MKENTLKAGWVPVYFPKGLKGSVNITIKGTDVVSADIAKTMIDSVESEGI